MPNLRATLIWAALLGAVVTPVVVSLQSPLLEWRTPIYIAAGLAGVLGMALMLVQPLLAGGALPLLRRAQHRRWHRIIGSLLVGSVLVHVAGLWVTSPPDLVDALLFRSPTPFSAWGVLAMWGLLALGLGALLRPRLGLRWWHWRVLHTALALAVVICTILHAALIEGTMGTVSKVVLSAMLGLVTVKTYADLRVWSRPNRAARRDLSRS